jgi:uncharacterized membrane protein YhhN
MQRPLTIVLVALTALAAMALVYFLRIDSLSLAAGAKVIASTGFLATAISVGALQHRYGRVLFIGLVLSFAGDMMLIGVSQSMFLLGLGSFLLAHLAYITAFATLGRNRKWALVSAIPVLLSAAAATLWLTPHLAPNLILPVHTYIGVISLMVIAAFASKGAGASTLVVAGALLFFVSDLSVAAQRIVVVDFPTVIWGLPLYYAGQLCLALSSSQSSSQ